VAFNWASVTRKDLALGIDTFAAPGAAAPGSARRLRNVDTSAAGSLTTRAGYEGYYGWIPFRVAQAEHDGTLIRLQFATSQQIDLSTSKLGPLVVVGRLSSAQSGDLTSTDATLYYPTYRVSSRVGFAAGSNTLTRTAAQHGLATQYLWAGVAESADPNSLSNYLFSADDVQVDVATYDVALGYTAAAAFSGFIYYRNVAATSGQAYTANLVAQDATFTADDTTDELTSVAHGLTNGTAVAFATDDTLPGGLVVDVLYYVVNATADTFQVAETEGGAAIDLTDAGVGTHTWLRRSFSISAGTHGLSNFRIVPEEWSVDSSGTVKVTFTSDFTGDIDLVAAPLANIKTGLAATGTNTFTVSGQGTPFVFPAAYRYNSTLTGTSRSWSTAGTTMPTPTRPRSKSNWRPQVARP
jgi:hypothetical protein